ncbi:MAG: hypothetical protein ACHREM_09350 [Polyangiales bacterium]
MIGNKVLWLASLVALITQAAGCKPSRGDSCGEATSACANPHTMLVCKSGLLSEVACPGDNGCVVDDKTKRASCDFSSGKNGDSCDTTLNGERMCKSDKEMLACRDNKVSILKCRGPNGCTPDPDERKKSGDPTARVKSCDDSVAKIGDECDSTWAMLPVCDDSGKLELVCNKKEHKYERRRACRGPKGCKSVDGKGVCDASVKVYGDWCEPDVDRNELCSLDGKSMLFCRTDPSEGDRMRGKRCPGDKGCSKISGSIYCDDGKHLANDACKTAGDTACEAGGTSLLECRGGKYARKTKCAEGCAVMDTSTAKCGAEPPLKP